MLHGFAVDTGNSWQSFQLTKRQPSAGTAVSSMCLKFALFACAENVWHWVVLWLLRFAAVRHEPLPGSSQVASIRPCPTIFGVIVTVPAACADAPLASSR